jgi:O-antigen/teichoic acid export membrane protein
LSILRKLAGETAIYGLSSILGRVLNYLIMTPYLVRELSTGEYGKMSELFSWIALLMIFLTYRLETAFFRFGAAAESRDKVFATGTVSLLATSLFFGIAFFSLADHIAEWLMYPGEGYIIRLIVLITLADTFCALPFARLRLEEKAWKFATFKVINILINAASILFLMELLPHVLPEFYQDDLKVFYVFAANIIASVATVLLLLPSYGKIVKQAISGASQLFDKELLQKMLLYAWPLIIVSFAGVINEVIDRIMLKFMLSPEGGYNMIQVGIYSGCYKLAIFMTLMIQAFQYAAEPFFFRHAANKGDLKVYADAARWFFLLGSGVFLVIMLNLFWLKWIISEDYHEGLHVVPVLLIANLFLGLYYNISIWYRIKDRTKTGAKIALSGAAITLAANLALIPLVEYTGSAIATLLAYAWLAAICYFAGRKIFPVPYDLWAMGKMLLLSLAVWGLNSYLFDPTTVSWTIAVLVQLLFFLVWVLLISLMEKSIRDRMMRVLGF